ncbi:uncharacterized protein KY384_006436 [Bacidia gigantensis]|uniref:uncharacterized protein n=1 Tax=Bacidia gigantensis TaxID=2732470 RepID=UPI001D0375C7|nr:uncharacterized protein KY384_006436 [Bacidia gigantensis]KAG8528749.1 hypothetical protein KY384_006436 [Bacidia gigantensis]
MAKPREGLPGNSGHIHVSLVDKSGNNLFYRREKDLKPPFEGLAYVSDIGRQFLAGLLDGLPDIMPIVAPTINSYKRLVENFWAPVTVSWGLEHRAASIRLIAPPTGSAKATRFEVRVAGADANPFLVLAAVLGLGWRGVEKKMAIKTPPLGKGEDVGGASDQGLRLAKSLKEATTQMMREGSVAREVFGNDFVEHFGGTREHEIHATGPSDATSAILIIYDVFGYSDQAIQGADILAHADGPDHQYRVFMPDFFYGKPLALEVFPPNTEEKQKQFGDFFAGPAEPGMTSKKVLDLVKEIGGTSEGKGIQKWGSLGACWGGKIVSLTAQSGTPFSVGAEVHPAMIDPNDAKGIQIPVCMLASGDEDKEAVQKWKEAHPGENHVETFEDQVHGWMGARGDLKDARVKAEYERGYKTLLEFYHKYL